MGAIIVSKGDAHMPSPAMQDLIDAFRDSQQARAGQAPPVLAERRATFAPAGRLHPVPGDVLVRDVNAGGVPDQDPISTPARLRQFAAEQIGKFLRARVL
jgi:hypothetical protein